MLLQSYGYDNKKKDESDKEDGETFLYSCFVHVYYGHASKRKGVHFSRI